MTTCHHESRDRWPQYFAERGHSGARRLAAGVEGTVYRLDGGIVAKVWNGRTPTDLDLRRELYTDLARHPLPFATPQILDIAEHDRVLITYERELCGAPLRPDSAVAPTREPELPGSQTDAVLTVLRALARVPATSAMRRLTVQGDDRPLWRGHVRFPDALAALVHRATRRHGELLATRVPDLSVKVDRTVAELQALPDSAVGVIHGDLVPPNIHVNDTGQPVAVLDFGFFTTAGDPGFEAAVTAVIWDMYGPHARHHAAALTGLFAESLGYSVQTMALYQAAYALTTYDLFTADGSDGHFRWCAALLREPVVPDRPRGRR